MILYSDQLSVVILKRKKWSFNALKSKWNNEKHLFSATNNILPLDRTRHLSKFKFNIKYVTKQQTLNFGEPVVMRIAHMYCDK